MKRKISITILLLLVIISFSVYKYIYPDHRNIEQEEVAFVIDSNSISEEFLKNPSISEQKYLDKTIELTGVTTEITLHTITLNDKVFCQFAEQLNSISTDEYLKIKGRVIGYDDLLEQVKLDQCHIIN